MEMPKDFSIQDAMRLASTPTGQQLIALLRAQNGDTFRKAMSAATAGDYESAKNTIEAMLSDPQAQKLLKDLGR